MSERNCKNCIHYKICLYSERVDEFTNEVILITDNPMKMDVMLKEALAYNCKRYVEDEA